VSFTGSPTAVVAVARALAQVVVVTGMAHMPDASERIRLEATCYHPNRTGRPSCGRHTPGSAPVQTEVAATWLGMVRFGQVRQTHEPQHGLGAVVTIQL
jgi:hypothetical protein